MNLNLIFIDHANPLLTKFGRQKETDIVGKKLVVSDIFMYLCFELQSSLHGYYFLLNSIYFLKIYFSTLVLKRWILNAI